MFTWIPIHQEAAAVLINYENRQDELIALLQRMHDAGLSALKLADLGAGGEPTILQEIDPFTFFSNFNRPNTVSNRKALWAFIKREWNLVSPVPDDFDGLPLMNHQKTWFVTWAKDRDPEHVPTLWRFFSDVLTATRETLDTDLMEKCMGFKGTAMTNLTMGMFWMRPDLWISTDAKNVAYAGQRGSELAKPRIAADYPGWLDAMNSLAGGNAKDFSYQAHIWATAKPMQPGKPFDKLFRDHEPEEILELFSEVLEVLSDCPDFKPELLVTSLRQNPCMRILYADWVVLSWGWHVNSQSFQLILPQGVLEDPEVTRLLEPVKGTSEGSGSYFLVKKDDLLEQGALWDAFIAFLPEVVSKFSHHKSSQFLRWHRPEIHLLISDLRERERILAEGVRFIVDSPQRPEGPRCWLIAPGEGAALWEECLREGIISIGWDETGDRTALKSRKEIEDAVMRGYPDSKTGSYTAVGKMLFDFNNRISVGDLVFAKKGQTDVLGWGRVVGPCKFDGNREEQHHFIPVKWESRKVAPSAKQLPNKTLTEKTGDPEFLELIATHYELAGDRPETVHEKYGMSQALGELFIAEKNLETIIRRLGDKKNIILQGAPGVGKTFIARRLAHLILGNKDDTSIEMVQFHQSSSYEDFVEGIKPDTDTGGFKIEKGIFRRFCERAASDQPKPYFLIIDEINRGNLSKILGELMMLIESDKRGEKLTLSYSREQFSVPGNVHIIGTMNTADRSLSMVDYALRRRFSFLTLAPGFDQLSFESHLGGRGIDAEGVNIIRRHMGKVNEEILADPNLGKGYCIGHSFFTPAGEVKDFALWYADRLDHEILPLLEEYWMDDPERVEDFRRFFADANHG